MCHHTKIAEFDQSFFIQTIELYICGFLQDVASKHPGSVCDKLLSSLIRNRHLVGSRKEGGAGGSSLEFYVEKKISLQSHFWASVCKLLLY